MLNQTSSYYHPKEIDFTVMGLLKPESDFLNWAMSQYDNLQFMKQCKTLEKKSTQTVLHHDAFASIEIDDVVKNRKT